MKPNKGQCPREAVGKRVIVKLRNGRIAGREQVTSVSPPGWDAKTTRWSLTDSPFDVIGYEVIK